MLVNEKRLVSVTVKATVCWYLDILEGVAHHGDQHVDEDDNHGDVVRGEQEHANTLHDRRGVVPSRE